MTRTLSWISLVLSVVVLATSISGYVYYQHLNDNVRRVDVFGLMHGSTQPPKAPDRSENVLLVGSDTRNGYTAAELAATGTTSREGGALSDTMMVVHVPADGSRVTIVSFPRDSLVTIPAWTDPKTGQVHAEHQAKLNAAFSEGDLPEGNAALTVATIERLSRLHIDHYLQIDFIHFIQMVNALGGLNVCVSPPGAVDVETGLSLPSGTSHINGKQALAFVRQRHGLPNFDLDRIKRQQYFIGTMFKKVTSAGILLNPIRLTSFLDQATSAVVADRDFSLNAMKNFALRLRRLDPQHVLFATIPTLEHQLIYPLGDVLPVDQPGMEALLGPLRGTGASPRPSSTGQPARPLVVPASAVSVQILNGSGVAGLASRAATDLGAAGFQVAGTGNADPATAPASSIVRFGPNRAEAARTLAAAVPGVTLQPDSSLGDTVVLIVGSGYAGAHQVGPGTAASAAPSASASASSGTTAPRAAAVEACAPGGINRTVRG